MQTTVGQLLVNQALPPQLRDYNRVLDKKGLEAVLQELAERYPDQYRSAAKRLSDAAITAAYRSGGMSFGVRDLRSTPTSRLMRLKLQHDIQQTLNGPGDEAAKQARIVKLMEDAQEPMADAIMRESEQEGSQLAAQVRSGAGGTKINLKSLRGSDGLYVDHRDRVIPVAILRSYSEGLSPAEYWAGTYGARKGIVDVKLATAKAGFLGKQLAQATHRLLVTELDDPEDDGKNEFRRGLPVDTDDEQSSGALLAYPAGGYPRNTVLSPKILRNLKAMGVNRILARSPITGGSPLGGVYGRDVGVRERGDIAPKGDWVGIAAAQAISERLSQGQLCLAAGTYVRMADWSEKRIEDIRVGDMVLGADRFGNAFPVQVLRTYDNGRKRCVKTEFKISKTKETIELVSTKDHKILAKSVHWALPKERVEWGVMPVDKRALRLGGVMVRQVDHDGGTLTEPLALLVGLLLGDGCYTESVNGVHLSCFDPTLISDIRDYLLAHGLKITKLNGHPGYYRLSMLQDKIQQDPKTGQTLPGARNPIKRWLIDRYMYGLYAHEKRLPDDVWHWRREDVLWLLGGLFATDGSVCRPKSVSVAYLNFASTSYNLVNQFRELLAVRFGIRPSPIGETNSGRKRTLYTFDITRYQDVVAFAKLFWPYVPGVKKQRLQKIVQTQTAGKPDTRFFYRSKQSDAGIRHTYDIEVAHPDHLFVLANGLIVSNSSKHAGGVAGASKGVAGFDLINQLVQVPKTFKGGAAHAQLDGRVEAIRPAPQGGQHLWIGGQEHYVAPEHELKVKVGQAVEAGDILSDGIPNPSEIVQHKGVGEGRRYFVRTMRDALAGAGIKAERRNLELLATGLIDHVQMTEEHDNFFPDDVVPYSAIAAHWRPRSGSAAVGLKRAVGQYLERPVLHHSIGTKVRASMLPELEEFGLQNLTVHPDPPPFAPVMIRAMGAAQHDPDPVTRHLGSYIQKSTLQAAHTGATSDPTGPSFVPALVFDPRRFGQQGLTQGWQPGSPTGGPQSGNGTMETVATPADLPF